MKNKVEKSQNKVAGQYQYRGVYIMNNGFGSGKWYVRCIEHTIENFPIGMRARTRGLLIQLIDRALDQGV